MNFTSNSSSSRSIKWLDMAFIRTVHPIIPWDLHHFLQWFFRRMITGGHRNFVLGGMLVWETWLLYFQKEGGQPQERGQPAFFIAACKCLKLQSYRHSAPSVSSLFLHEQKWNHNRYKQSQIDDNQNLLYFAQRIVASVADTASKTNTLRRCGTLSIFRKNSGPRPSSHGCLYRYVPTYRWKNIVTMKTG